MFEILIDFTLIIISGQPYNAKTFYDVFYPSLWAKHVNIELEHKYLYNSIYKWYQDARTNSVSNCVDKILFVLTMQILLLNTDGLAHQLKNKKLVEEAQQKYASMLHYYLKCHHPTKYRSLLARALMLVHDTQRIHELNIQRLKLF